jgi:hypothetical protein
MEHLFLSKVPAKSTLHILHQMLCKYSELFIYKFMLHLIHQQIWYLSHNFPHFHSVQQISSKMFHCMYVCLANRFCSENGKLQTFLTCICIFKLKYVSFPEIISTAERTDIAPHVKDGYIMMFIYMPVVFTSEFTPYIGQIINPILKVKFLHGLIVCNICSSK